MLLASVALTVLDATPFTAARTCAVTETALRIAQGDTQRLGAARIVANRHTPSSIDELWFMDVSPRVVKALAAAQAATTADGFFPTCRWNRTPPIGERETVSFNTPVFSPDGRSALVEVWWNYGLGASSQVCLLRRNARGWWGRCRGATIIR